MRLRALGDTHNSSTRTGFTIVELLIVIVVIAILAAISIVAYNGIQNRARASAASSALTQAAKKIAVWQVDNPSATPDCSTFSSLIGGNGSACSFISNGIDYQYLAGASGSYCVTATAGPVSYKTSETTSPAAGSCPGHGSGGVAPITNLMSNPSLESSTSGWGNYNGGGAVATSRPSDGGFVGNSYYRVSWTSATPTINGGFYPASSGLPALTVGSTYTASVYVRSNKAQAVRASLTFRDGANTSIGTTTSGSPVSLVPNIWTRLSIAAQAPASSAGYVMTVYSTGGGSTWQPGDTLDGDAAMFTEGGATPAYADGNTPNWIWNGIANGSTSTGPPL